MSAGTQCLSVSLDLHACACGYSAVHGSILLAMLKKSHISGSEGSTKAVSGESPATKNESKALCRKIQPGLKGPRHGAHPLEVRLGFTATMIFSSRFILNLFERLRDGISGKNSHSSRTPVSGGRQGPNHTLAPGMQSEILVNVITMHDMAPGQDVNDESASQMKGGEWAREDGSMA
ncbi:hypothetical protein C8R46DRAFT_1035976 [Mycena filopes]|nr:hypothetical protein C8R46DRAFT_1035976 [Mycena filopes]